MSICKDISQLIANNLTEILRLRNNFKVKPDGSYVSQGDLLCQSIIVDYLKDNHPQYAIISEETWKEGIEDDYFNCIVIDPIDGTENFVSGLSEWGVGVSVYNESKHVDSLIALPELHKYLYTGVTPLKYKSRIVGLSSSLTKEDLLLQEEGYEYRIMGCSMYNLFNAVTGSFNRYINNKGANCWDILPGLNLALENNCVVTLNDKPYAGEFLKPGAKYCFAIRQK
jgi:myo-inositol-1(or 4)-monophosphatase